MATKKDNRKMVKLYFKKSPPKWGYHAGVVHEVPEDVEKKHQFVKNGYATVATPVLPADIPYRKEIIAHGIETFGELEDLKDLKSIKGVGDAGEEEILDYLKKRNS